MVSTRTRVFLVTLALGPLSSPAAALPAAGTTNLPLSGNSTGTVSVNISTTPSPVTFAASGQLSHLGAFTATGNESFTPQGLPPAIPYTVAGTETLIVANGDKLFGSVTGTGVNSSGAAHGTNAVTVTGGTGRFAGAAGSFTETYTSHVTAYVGTTQSGSITTSLLGNLLVRASCQGGNECHTVPGQEHASPPPPSAMLGGLPTACAATPFTARVIGQGIASVRWSLDGRPIPGQTRRTAGRYSAHLALSEGAHALVAHVSFAPSTRARPRTLHRKLIGCPIEREDFRHALSDTLTR